MHRHAPAKRRHVQDHRPGLLRHERPDADRRAQHADDPAGLRPPADIAPGQIARRAPSSDAILLRRPPAPPVHVEQHARKANQQQRNGVSDQSVMQPVDLPPECGLAARHVPAPRLLRSSSIHTPPIRLSPATRRSSAAACPSWCARPDSRKSMISQVGILPMFRSGKWSSRTTYLARGMNSSTPKSGRRRPDFLHQRPRVSPRDAVLLLIDL